MEYSKILAERLKEVRKENGYTQQSLANKLYCTKQLVYQMEKGERKITEPTAHSIAKIFPINAKYLLDENEKYKNNIEKINDIAKENELIINTILSLAKLNGYEVKINVVENGSTIDKVFSKINQYMVFYINGKKEFSLSLFEVNSFGNNLSEIFNSNIKWFIKKK